MNENEETTFLNIWDADKAVLRRKFIVVNAQIQKKTDFTSKTSFIQVIIETWKNESKLNLNQAEGRK